VLQRTQGRQLPLLLQSYNLTIIVLGLAFPFLPYTRTHRQQCRVSNLHGMESMMRQETTTTSFDPLIRLQSFFRWIYIYIYIYIILTSAFLKFSIARILPYLDCNQIWLNIPVHDRHSGYITKLTGKKKWLARYQPFLLTGYTIARSYIKN